MKEWARDVGETINFNKKCRKIGGLFLLIGFILFVIGAIFATPRSEDPKQQFDLLDLAEQNVFIGIPLLIVGFISIMYAFYNLVHIKYFSKTELTAYRLYTLFDDIHSYKTASSAYQKNMRKKVITKNLDKLISYADGLEFDKSQAWDEKVNSVVNPDNLKELVYKINYALSYDKDIKDDLVEEIKKYCLNLKKVYDKLRNEGKKLYQPIATKLDEYNFEIEKAIFGKIKYGGKIFPSVKSTKGRIFAALFMSVILVLIVEYLIPIMWNIDDNVKVFFIGTVWIGLTILIWRRRSPS